MSTWIVTLIIFLGILVVLVMEENVKWRSKFYVNKRIKPIILEEANDPKKRKEHELEIRKLILIKRGKPNYKKDSHSELVNFEEIDYLVQLKKDVISQSSHSEKEEKFQVSQDIDDWSDF